MIVGCTIATIAEALKMASDNGVDASKLPECLAGGFADSTILQNHARRMAEGNLSPRGHATTMLKDMDICLRDRSAIGHGRPNDRLDDATLSAARRTGIREARSGRPDAALCRRATLVEGIQHMVPIRSRIPVARQEEPRRRCPKGTDLASSRGFDAPRGRDTRPTGRLPEFTGRVARSFRCQIGPLGHRCASRNAAGELGKPS